MSDRYSFTGSFSTEPMVGSPSFAMSCIAPIDESLVVKNWKRVVVDLTTDLLVEISLDQMVNVAAIAMRVIEGGPKAKATITSSDGAAQVIPFEYFVLGSQTVPISVVSLTRVSGTATKVEVFLAEKA